MCVNRTDVGFAKLDEEQERLDRQRTMDKVERAARECTACGAGVAEHPEAMCCHCREVPWKLREDALEPLAEREAEAEERAARALAAFDHNCSVPDWNREAIDRHWPKYLPKVRAVSAALREPSNV